MKSKLLSVFLFLSTIAGAQTTDLSIKVSNASGDEGEVIFSLFDKETFLVAPPLASKASDIKNGVASVKFENLEPGEYGVVVIHDKNRNGTIDFNAQGIPLEDYGSSNNSMSFGPPQWKDAKFTLGEESLSLEIRF